MKVAVVYDGLCPMCRSVVRMARLRDRAAELQLVDARTEPLDNIQGHDLRSIDYDQGFVLVVDGRVFQADEAAQVLAGLTEPGTLPFRLFQTLVRTESRSKLTYPVLRSARNLLLRILGVPKFGA